MVKRKGLRAPVERLDCCDDEADSIDSMRYIDLGADALVTFNFMDTAEADKPVVEQKPLANTAAQAVPSKAGSNKILFDNRTNRTKPYGVTPPVDGERFDVRRTFLFRRSTVRMLNRMKAEHEDENVYLSSIVDEALRFYYKNYFRNAKESKNE